MIKYLRTIFPQEKHIAIGYSMSANILLLLLSKGDPSFFPDAAITVNAPIDLKNSSALLQKGFNRIYDKHFVYNFRQILKIKEKLGHLESKVKLPWISTTWDFDELYTAPASGFKSREHYYQECSSIEHLSKIKTPTFVLTAADDPFVNVETYRKAQWSSAVQLTISEKGGHLGYYDKRPLENGNHRWLDVYLSKALLAITAGAET